MGLQGVEFSLADRGLYGHTAYVHAGIDNAGLSFRHHTGDGHIYEGQSFQAHDDTGTLL